VNAVASTLVQFAHQIADRLEAAGIEPGEARLDAELLLRSALEWDRARWFAESRSPVPAALAGAMEPVIRRRVSREPMAYVLGGCEFWGRFFEVTPDVLIPRPETEIIVEQALARIPAGLRTTVFDAGTGSGCLAVTIALERPDCLVHATDISSDALAVARRNAQRHGVSNRVVFEHAALLGGSGGTPGMIVSNPPYVPVHDHASLQPEVRDYEPKDALVGGEDGLDIIRALVDRAARSGGLTAGGWLIFEFGMGQRDAVQECLTRHGAWDAIEFVPDLQGIPRVAAAQLRS
jgi:release factor glutamine methyltransferase